MTASEIIELIYSLVKLSVEALADPELQKRGSQILSEIFNDSFLGVCRKKFSISAKNFIYLPKFLTTFFLIIDYFRVLICCFSVGGPNP